MKKIVILLFLLSNICFSQKLSKEERQLKLDERKNNVKIKTKINDKDLILTEKLLNSEQYKLEEKTVTGVFDIEDKSKSEIFSLINRWVSINYNSAMNVIQMNDKESGTIIVKGVNVLSYKSDYLKEVIPFIRNNFYLSFNHLIEVNIRDNKYRVIYKITEISDEYPISTFVSNDLIFFQCVKFNGNNENFVPTYNKSAEKYLKAMWVGKNKRELVLSQTKTMFDEMNEKIKLDIYLKMKSIENSVKSDKKDDW